MNSGRIRGLGPASVEARVKEIWKDVLGTPRGRTDVSFLELGGQSIAAIRIVARIEDEFGVEIDIGSLFEDPTADSFARDVARRLSPDND